MAGYGLNSYDLESISVAGYFEYCNELCRSRKAEDFLTS
jgi:hypothetical protein